MPFEIIRNDITNMHVDAVVNTANPRPMIGSGTDAAIHAKAGPQLLEARKRIGFMNTAETCITPGFGLPAKYVIHTVGPVWHDGAHGEEYLLRLCYRQSLKLAKRHKLESIAFPLISTGNYGFPKQLALQTAKEEIETFLKDNEMQVYLVVFSKDTFELSEGLVNHVKNFLDERYVQEKTKAEYGFSGSRTYDGIRKFFEEIKENNRRKKEAQWDRDHPEEDAPERTESVIDENMYASESDMFSSGWDDFKNSCGRTFEKHLPKKQAISIAELKERLEKTESSFSDSLLMLIDRTGKKDSEIYKKANISRKLFSKIRNNPYYKPSKTTAVAFAIALELDLEQTKEFIGKAGYALSSSSKFDIIIEYFITHGHYDIHEINLMLFEFDQSLLGA